MKSIRCHLASDLKTKPASFKSSSLRIRIAAWNFQSSCWLGRTIIPHCQQRCLSASGNERPVTNTHIPGVICHPHRSKTPKTCKYKVVCACVCVGVCVLITRDNSWEFTTTTTTTETKTAAATRTQPPVPPPPPPTSTSLPHTKISLQLIFFLELLPETQCLCKNTRKFHIIFWKSVLLNF